MTELTREQQAALRQGWFSSVRDLSDFALQRSRWLDPTNRNPHWSYIEFVCKYPAHDQLQFAKAKGFLTGAEFDVLRDLRNTLVSYSAPGGDDYDNAAVLDDPSWHQVVAEADRARHRLLDIVTNQIERDTLLRKI